jgi:transcriptional regulator with XRE-family HTH domain
MDMTLGSYLKSFRKKKELKASDVLEKAGLTGSLALYSQWENDKKLPTPEALEKVCLTLGANKKIAFYLWAQANMPSKSLKKLFDFNNVEFDSISNQPTIETEIFYPAAVTKTIQERDSDFFIENPAAGAILMRALASGNLSEGSWPIEKMIDGLGINKVQGKALLQELIKRHYIVEVNGKYRTPEGIKYIYMPESAQFEKLRKERIKFNFNRVLNNIDLEDLKSQKALRINLTNKLSQHQLADILNTLRGVSDDFLKAEDLEDQKYFQLLILVGPEYEKQ